MLRAIPRIFLELFHRKSFLTTLAAVVVTALCMFLYSLSMASRQIQGSGESVTALATPRSTPPVKETASSVPIPDAPASPPPIATLQVADAPSTADKETILDHLVQYSTSYEATSLPLITPYLSSEDPEIRDAAINAIVVIGNAAGSPILRKAAATMNDAHVAAEMLDKADYLELPSATFASGQASTTNSSEVAPATP